MSNQNHEDPLDSLFVDRQPLDKLLLVDLIQPYIRLYGDKPEVVTTTSWKNLTISQKLVTFMLGKKL